MRGQARVQNELFSYIPLESRVPSDHPLRRLRELADGVLEGMSQEFDAIYSATGRPSIAPEMLLKALFLQVLYGIRSEYQLLEQIRFNLLYRWFVGLGPDNKVWDESVFTKNRERLLDGEIADVFFSAVVKLADSKGLVSEQHFTVDGTLIEAWASLKSFQPKSEDGDDTGSHDDGDPGNPSVDFHGQTRSNATHQSRTDPDAKLYRKSKGTTAKLNFTGNIMMENRHGLAVGAMVNQAGYYAEHDAALEMAIVQGKPQDRTLGADKHYDNDYLCTALKILKIRPHVAQNIHSHKKTSAVDKRTTRHEGYAVSQKKRKRVEEIFGWLKQWSIMRRSHFRGLGRLSFQFKFSVATYNLLRISNILTRQELQHA